MATQNYAASVQGAAIRVTRLAADGSLLNGELDSYTTSAFMRVSFTPEYEDGEEITEKAANGTVCVSYKAPDRLKRVTMEVAICEPDPELSALIAGGVLLTKNLSTASTVNISSSAAISSGSVVLTLASASHGITVGKNVTIANVTSPTALNGISRVTNVSGADITVTTTAGNGSVTVGSGTVALRDDSSVGWAAPAIGDDPAGNGVAIEVWSFAVADGKRVATNPFFHWIFPYCRLRQSGDRVIENGMLANTFEGYGIGNTSFLNGPDGRWEWQQVTDRPYAYARAGWSPSTQLLKGFYTWSGTTYTATPSLPVAMIDADFNIPGGFNYDSSGSLDIALNE